jgi:TonB family protein
MRNPFPARHFLLVATIGVAAISNAQQSPGPAQLVWWGVKPTVDPAQQPSSSVPAALASEAKALMLAASKLNNLATADARPWHIMASFQLFDEQGTVTDEGTYEEFWAGPTKFKRTFTGKAFAQTDYGSEKGDMRVDAHGDVPTLLMNTRYDLVSSLPNEQAIQHQSYSAKPIETGALKLICLTTAPGEDGRRIFSPTYCVGTSEPILRISADAMGTTQTLHNRILRFENRTIAGDLKLTRNSKPAVTLHVDSIENLDAASESIFTPPPDAVLVPRRIAISGAVAQGLLTHTVDPVYPAEARASHISGTVVLHGVISKEGHIKNLQAISGPSALQQAAVEAVLQWRYKPYLLNGNPVEVDTTVNVVFHLGNN